MTSFDARLRMLGQTGLPLGVEIDLSGERMILIAGDAQVANWPLGDIRVVSRSDGFHVEAEGEEVVLNVTDSDEFALELGTHGVTPGYG